jgi:undecaprenyl-diphosphatase
MEVVSVKACVVGGARWGLVVACVLSVLGPAFAQDEERPPERLTVWEGLALGLTEGLTEYLPVSSTGHLYLVERLMGVGIGDGEQEAADAYAIAIQLGAILAVLWLYWGRVALVAQGLVGKNPEGRRLLVNLLLAFAPAVVVGLLAEHFIKRYLFGLWPITAAWLVGGLAIFVTSRRERGAEEGLTLDELRPGQALLIGGAQVFAMWPGVSRSLATILGGVAVGLSPTAAVEFSFLLGLVTLGAATLKEIAANGPLMVATFGWVAPLVGLVAAFISAALAVKWMVGFVTRRGLAVFGYYRIALAVVVAVWLLLGP